MTLRGERNTRDKWLRKRGGEKYEFKRGREIRDKG